MNGAGGGGSSPSGAWVRVHLVPGFGSTCCRGTSPPGAVVRTTYCRGSSPPAAGDSSPPTAGFRGHLLPGFGATYCRGFESTYCRGSGATYCRGSSPPTAGVRVHLLPEFGGHLLPGFESTCCRGSSPPTALRNLGYFVQSTLPMFFGRDTFGHFYLVSMPGNVRDQKQGNG